MEVVEVALELRHAAGKLFVTQAAPALCDNKSGEHPLNANINRTAWRIVDVVTVARLLEGARLDVGLGIGAVFTRQVVWQVLKNAAMNFFQMRGIEVALYRLAFKLSDAGKGKGAFLLPDSPAFIHSIRRP